MPQLPDYPIVGRYLCAATEDFFTTMVGLPLRAGELSRTLHATGRRDGVFATVGIAGWLTGTGTVSLSDTLACRVASAFLGADYAEVNFDVLDAVGEMANMIVGQLKTNLEQEASGEGLQLSLPTVVYGKNFVTRALSQQDALSVDFDLNGERLTVALCLRLQPATEGAGGTFVHPHFVAG